MSALAGLNPLATLDFHRVIRVGKCAAKACIFELLLLSRPATAGFAGSADGNRTPGNMIGT